MGFDLLTSVPHEYTLQSHRGDDGAPKPGAPKWLLRSLPSRLMLALTALSARDPQLGVAALVEAGLVGFEGVTQDGQPATFKPGAPRHVHGIEVNGGVDPELLDLLPFRVLTELGGELMRINTLDVESAKN